MYRQNFAQVVSQAAIHLHNEMGSIGTALYDSEAGLVFNNNVLRYVDESTLARLVSDCFAECVPGRLTRRNLDGVMVRALSLDDQHVFIVVGNRLEDSAINRFFASLQGVLPQPPALAD